MAGRVTGAKGKIERNHESLLVEEAVIDLAKQLGYPGVGWR